MCLSLRLSSALRPFARATSVTRTKQCLIVNNRHPATHRNKSSHIRSPKASDFRRFMFRIYCLCFQNALFLNPDLLSFLFRRRSQDLTLECIRKKVFRFKIILGTKGNFLCQFFGSKSSLFTGSFSLWFFRSAS